MRRPAFTDNTAAEFDRAIRDRLLEKFAAASNRIEGIVREPTSAEVHAHRKLLCRKRLTVADVEDFVKACAADAVLRATTEAPNVRVGRHIAPPSGPEISERLADLLKRMARDEIDSFEAHVAYETLHPFTDGNGRSGRALWLWQMKRQGRESQALNLGFLHAFYYQALDICRADEAN